MAEEKKYLGQSGIATFRDWIKGNFVAQEEGKGLSANDLTDELVAKIEAAAAANDLDALEALVGTLPEGTTAKTIVEYVNAKTEGIATDAALAELQGQLTAAQGNITDIQNTMATDDELAAAKTELEGKIATAVTDMATNAGVAEAIKDMATDQEVEAAVSAAKQEIEGKGYQNAEQVAAAVTAGTEGMATQTWVGEQIAEMATDAEVEAAVDALKTEVEGAGYQNASQVSSAIATATANMATDDEVAAAVEGLASESWVEGKGYDTATSVDGKVSAAKTELTTAIGTAKTEANAYTDEQITAKVSTIYKPQGSCAFADLPAPSVDVKNYVYNIRDPFVTTDSFIEGANGSYPAGSNVACIEVDGGYKWDVLMGLVDLTPYQKAEDIVEYTADEITAILNA